MIRQFSRLTRVGRLGFLVFTGGYASGLIVYLVARLLFGDRFWWLALLNNFAPFYFLPLPVVFVLALAMRARRVAAGIAGLLVIGVVWFGPRFLPKAYPVPVGPILRIATFNVWGDNPNVDMAEAWFRQTKADLILVQEIPRTYADHGAPNLADLYPYQFNRGWQWGNMTLSRHTFLASEHLDFAGDGSRPVQQRLVIELNGQKIAIYNIHLALPAGDNARLPASSHIIQLAARYDTSVRNREITGLITQLKNEPYPFIVAGDFNMSDQAVTYQSLAAVMGDTFREIGVGLGGSWPVPIAADLPDFMPPLVRIDYVWHSAQFRAIEALQGAALGSDHLPLGAALELLPVKPS